MKSVTDIFLSFSPTAAESYTNTNIVAGLIVVIVSTAGKLITGAAITGLPTILVIILSGNSTSVRGALILFDP